MPENVFRVTAVFALAVLSACSHGGRPRYDHADHPAVVVPPGEGTVRWWMADEADTLGAGGRLDIKVDRVSVPYANLMVTTQKTAASGIPVHLHVSEDELLYVLSGNGFAIVGEDRREIAIETGSVVYVPIGEWHGVRNAKADERMEILVVTTPVEKDGLGDFFRNVGTEPGHPPLNVSEEEFRELFRKYGMRLPED